MELHETIKEIVDKFGKDIIAERRFLYMLADYYSFRDNPAEKHILSILINNGYSSRLLGNYSEIELSIIVSQIINEVQNKYGFREDLIEEILTNLLWGLNIKLTSLNSNCQTLQKCTSENKSDKNNPIRYYLKAEHIYTNSFVEYNACGYYSAINGTFVILKGSLLATQCYHEDRRLINDKLRRKEILGLYCDYVSPHYVVNRDIICMSPEEASFIVTGMILNGMSVWIDNRGKCISDNLSAKKSSLRSYANSNTPFYSEEYVLSLYPILFQNVSHHAHMDFDVFQKILKMDSDEAFQLFRFLKGMGVYVFNNFSDDYDLEVDSRESLKKLYRKYVTQKQVQDIPLSMGITLKRSSLEVIIKKLYKFKFISIEDIKSELLSFNYSETYSREIFNILLRLGVIDGMGRCLNPYMTPESMVNIIINKIVCLNDVSAEK